MPDPGQADEAPVEPAGNGNGSGGLADMGTPSDAAPRRRGAHRPPNYTHYFARRADRAGPSRPAHRGRHGRACPPAPASTSSQAEFPDRFIDVGIAEQHAVALVGGHGPGRRAAGRGPVLHLPAAGLRPGGPRRLPERPAGPASRSIGPAWWARTGPATRACSRIPSQRQLPHMIIASPKDEQELRSLVRTALRPGSPVRAPLPARPRVRRAGDASRRSCRSASARCCARDGRS